MAGKLNKDKKFLLTGLAIIAGLFLSIIFIIHYQQNLSDRKPKDHYKILGDYVPKTIDLTKYLNDKNVLKPVNTNIKTINDKDYKYANITNNFKSYFSQKIEKDNDNDIKIQKDDSWITFNVISNLDIYNNQDNKKELIDSKDKNSLDLKDSQTIASADKQKNKIKYTNIYEKDSASMDAAYTVFNDRLSEEIIINKFLGFPKISQKLTFNNVFYRIEFGRINFYSQTTRRLLWYIPQPKMYEQKNQSVSSNEIKIQVDYIDSTHITLTKVITDAGEKWLSDPKRKYPVILDPSFQIDSADNSANWISSDNVHLTVSQETTIKQEGTGSVKVVGSGVTQYWSTDGGVTQDLGCTNAVATGTSINTTCSSSLCVAGHWDDTTNCTVGTTSAVVINTTCGGASLCVAAHWNNAGCTNTNYSTYAAYTTCTATDCGYGNYSYAATGSLTAHTGNAVACTPGVLPCYYMVQDRPGYRYSAACGGTGCGPDTFYTAYACSWVASTYSYAAGTPVTKYSGSGTCTPGVNPCYRLSGSYSNVTSGGCGSSGCGSSGTYYDATACTWIPSTYSYTAGTTLTKYTGSGACTAGVPPCYKLAGTSYTNYSSTACGSGNCTSSGTYYDSTSCTWTSLSPLNNTVTTTKAPTDLSAIQYISFWVRSDRSGSFLQFQMGESSSSEQTFAFSIGATNTWEKKIWDISAIPATSRDAITKYAFLVTSSGSPFTFYFDDIQANAAPNPPSKCVIIESNTDTFLTPIWNDNSSDEAGFQLEKSTDGGAFSFLINLAAGVTGYQDTSISKDHTYSYRVRSYKFGVGTTDFSYYCNHPNLDLHNGNLRFNGLQLNGFQVN